MLPDFIISVHDIFLFLKFMTPQEEKIETLISHLTLKV